MCAKYVKFIQSGNYLERYEYKRSPVGQRRRKRKTYRRTVGARSVRNVYRSRQGFWRLLRSNCGRGNAPALVTLTMSDVVEIGCAYRRYTLFAQRFKRLLGGVWRCIAVPEFQRRGAVHFHCLVWGIPLEWIYDERDTRRIAKLWSWGYVDVRETDGSDRLVGYLAKYMSKAMFDDRLLGRRAYTVSGSIVRPMSFTGSSAVSEIERQVSSGELIHTPSCVLREREYDTLWMGRCNYKLYKFIDQYESSS